MCLSCISPVFPLFTARHLQVNPAASINQPDPHPHLKVYKVPVPPNLAPRCTAYVPCAPVKCAGCDSDECNDCFTCTKEECECPYPHEIAQGICDVANQYAYDWVECVGREVNEELCCMGECHGASAYFHPLPSINVSLLFLPFSLTSSQ